MPAKSDLCLRGIYRDTLYGPHGEVKMDTGGWRSNLVVDSARMLLAAFLKNDPTQGVQSFAVGQGDTAWDDDLPAPQPGDTELFDPGPFTLTAADLDFAYLNDNDAVVGGPTSRLQITATLGPNEPPPPTGSNIYALREFGLFGEMDGNPFMIDYVIHPVINKAVEDTLVRSIRLIF